MANLNGFNAHEVEPSAPFEPIPAGKYLAAITGSEMKAAKTGNGSYLQLTFTILEGEYKGRMVWGRLCLNHPNATTVKIARAELSAICRAVGVMQPRDSVELHNLPLVLTVKCKKRQDTGEIVNEICGYEPKAAAAGQPQQATAGANGAGNTPPWKR
jgi:hypothetical protein